MDDPKRYKEHITQIRVVRGKVKASLTRLEHSAAELESKNEGLLSDEPASLIKHIPLSNDSYEEAWGRLMDRALLDSGSESSFVSENVINILGLKRKNARMALSGISGVQAGTTRGSVNLKIGSRFSEECLTVNAFILNKVTSQIPVENINIKELDYLKGIPLSDEDFSSPSVCDIILESDCFFSILRNGKISGSEGQPIAQSTIFGWFVAGQIRRDSISSSYTQSHLISVENDYNINSVLQKFWQMEELLDKKFLMSDEEEFCENHFKSTYRINDQGRFVVRLPVYKDINQLGDTKGMAVSRLLAMERKFKFDSEFELEYQGFMSEYEELGHMSPNKDFDSSKPDYFLPHHAVQKKDTTRCLHQIGLDSQIINPEISKIIQNSFYMDDLMAGAKSNEEAIALIQKLSEILAVWGFHLRKWRSNSPHVLNNLAECLSANESNVEIHPENCSKTLGLIWNSSTGCFVFKIDFNFANESFLSQSARLFDPLGFLSPSTILIKIFYQQLWLLKLDWDSALPEHFAVKWRKFKKEFQQICHISIPRWLLITEKEIILHGFSDASQSAYACVIYAVQRSDNGVTKVTILAAESKVAPLNPVSIPRLELNGALLLARL
ncbi:hypothetical protein HNY73_010009 [Argiope bruennichi]|uniref:Peptidase aspartic putative domain-containing protein n=1 Tax=Argiope bruennichi TaxID=94029 RepID=A0A8T0F5L4_ARGBR|nr:hypothetical protein HNY73_010009 [Argiope bruennichi]